jgi:hypothetical protein
VTRIRARRCLSIAGLASIVALTGCAGRDGAPADPPTYKPLATILDLGDWQLATKEEPAPWWRHERPTLCAFRGSDYVDIADAASLAALLRSVRGEEDLAQFESLVARYRLDEWIPNSAWRLSSSFRWHSYPYGHASFIEPTWVTRRAVTRFQGVQAGLMIGHCWRRDRDGRTARFVVRVGPGRYQVALPDGE